MSLGSAQFTFYTLEQQNQAWITVAEQVCYLMLFVWRSPLVSMPELKKVEKEKVI